MYQRLAACLAVLAGCASASPDDAAIDPRVTILSQVPGAGMTVTADRLEFPRADNEALVDLAAGDIVASGAGEGFLRTVESVTVAGNQISIATVDAELGDAVVDGVIADSFGGEGKADTHQLPEIAFSITDRKVVDSLLMSVTIVDASIGLRPEIDLDIDVRDRKLSLFELVMRGRVTGWIDLDIDVKDITVGPEITLWTSPPAFFYQQIGAFPVVETVTTSVRLRLEALVKGHGRIRIQAGATADIAAGVHYTEESGWIPVAGLAVKTEGRLDEASVGLDEVGIRAWLLARADVKFYGAAGPFVSAGPQFEIARDVSASAFRGAAGFRGELGGELKVKRWNIPGIPKRTLFNALYPIF